MRILISSIGTGGDVNPYVAVALALKARGHEPIMVVNPYFEARVRGAGLEVETIGKAEHFLSVVKHEGLIHPTRGPQFVIARTDRTTGAAAV